MYIVVGNKTQTMSHPINTTRKIILKAVPILIFLVLSLVNWGTNEKRRFLDLQLCTNKPFEIKKFIGDKTSFIHIVCICIHARLHHLNYLWDQPTRVNFTVKFLKFFIQLIWYKVSWPKIVIVNIIKKKINNVIKSNSLILK